MRCKYTHINLYRCAFCVIFLIVVVLSKVAAAADCDCSKDIAEPPFLSSGVDPNLLMIIDNSASMLDLAYASSMDTCYDDSYSDTSFYAGYFEPGTWYTYTFTGKKFQAVADTAAGTFCKGSGTEYSSAYLCIDGTMTGTEMTEVSGLYATGNLLNWAAASKLDIQKKILTGGKYDSTNQLIKMESRGCGDRRFIKKIPVSYGNGTHYVTFAVRPPKAEVYSSWADDVAYVKGNVVSGYSGTLYIAQNDGQSDGSGPLDDNNIEWSEYWKTRWHNGTVYTIGDRVTDPSKENTFDKGRVYIALNSGTANGTGVDDDSGVSWEPYDLTHIDIFKGNATGFDNTACQAAIENIGSDSPNQGQLTKQIDECMGSSIDGSGGGGGSLDANNAFNHSIHDCWYWAKHGTWNANTNDISNDCQKIYENGYNPWEITTDDRAYVCFGQYTGSSTDPVGYVGRCWNPGQTSTQDCKWQCTNTKKEYPTECSQPNQQEYVCTGEGSTTAGWDNGGYSDPTTCIDTALQDFCKSLEIPEVIDPSDQVGSATGATDITWGLPAMLTDSGVIAQLDQPIATLEGFIEKNTEPLGLVQEYADDIRMGAMAFNHSGSRSECSQTDPYVLYECTDYGNKDGGKVIQQVGQSETHTKNLVTAINKIKASSWTPLAEAFYNAIGYFKQDSGMRLNFDDFPVGTDPIEYWCQNNNILIITEGASTADQHSDVISYTSTMNQNDGDTDTGTNLDCGTLDGSTLLDDLSWTANHLEGLFGQLNAENKRNITTHIVAAGAPRTDGTEECSPNTLLTSAAENGGTSLVTAADMTELETALRAAFSAIRAGAAAGSAASVISATRSGEGAVYQAIFWPDIDGPIIDGTQKPDVTWAGEVHALLVDAYGRLFEDTNKDRALTGDDRQVTFFFDENGTPAETKACYGVVENGVCTGEIKSLNDVTYLWSAAEWLAGISDTDIVQNRVNYISNERRRYIFTWNDLNNDGVVDANSGEVMEFEPEAFTWSTIGVAGNRTGVPADFGATTDGEVNALISWMRGKDGSGLRSRNVSRPDGFSSVTPSADNTITWRLGDVIYSTPTVVARPTESYHMLYQDFSYVDFLEKYKNRRNVVYFGANDGMIHAINGGFYNAQENKYCLTADCGTAVNAPALGAELWAYVPYNLQPQLKCLTDPNYLHRYYVDQKPRIFDVRIFNPGDPDYPGGWGTIMVVGMRLGGNSVDADSDPAVDNRKFTSSYVIFDITNPEKKPVLLGELTYNAQTDVNLGYTTAMPTVVPMKTGNTTKWYLVLGSGPIWLDSNGNWVNDEALSGRSNQTSKIAVFPLDELTAATPGAFRIPAVKPSTTGKGFWELADKGFVSDIITVDFDMDSDYRADALYFGTVEGDWATQGSSWGGKMYRIVTKADTAMTAPSTWANPSVVIDAQRPITAAPSIGWDGENYWLYFGTGRFFDKRDKSDISSNDKDLYFAIKEPLDCENNFTWDEVIMGNLVRTDQITVQENASAPLALLGCSDGGNTCLPGTVGNFNELVSYIAGEGCKGSIRTGQAGWYHEFPMARERNLGQATLLGGLLTFTTYQPFDDVCMPDGLSYLSAVYYQTGTPWHEAVFNTSYGTTNDPAEVVSRLELGHGLASTPNLHVGRQEGAKAFVQTSTGAIVEIEQPNLPIASYRTGRVSWRND